MTQTTHDLRNHVQQLNVTDKAILEQALRFAIYHLCECWEELETVARLTGNSIRPEVIEPLAKITATEIAIPPT